MRKIYTIPTPPAEVTHEIMPGKVFILRSMPSAAALMGWTSTLPATDRVFRSDDHFTHVHGAYSETYLIAREVDENTGEVTDDILEKILYAQAAVRELIGKKHKAYENPGWTFSRLANTVTAWLDIRQLCTQRDEIIEADKWNHQSARPGNYPHAAMWDIAGAYWQIWQRVPSPTFSIPADQSRIRWQTLSVEEARRWKRMHRLFDDPRLKRLHNAIVGTNVRGWNGKKGNPFNVSSEVYSGGAKVKMPINAGALLPLSLLTVRCTYELVQIQSEMSRAIYTQVDSVAVASDPGKALPRMSYWDQWNIKHRLKAEGVSIICDIGARAIGNDYTVPFFHAEKYKMRFYREAKRYENPYLHTLFMGG